ncbi:hypothetical protein Hanom_Chr15g01381641 [Helianthus anomalus]
MIGYNAFVSCLKFESCPEGLQNTEFLMEHLRKFGNMAKTLIYRKYQRHIHHVLTMLRPFRHSVQCYVQGLTIRSSTLYGSHALITIIPCAPAIILIVT